MEKAHAKELADKQRDISIMEKEYQRLVDTSNRELEKVKADDWKRFSDSQDAWKKAFERYQKATSKEKAEIRRQMQSEIDRQKSDLKAWENQYTKLTAELARANGKIETLDQRIHDIKEIHARMQDQRKRTKLRNDIKGIASDLNKLLVTNSKTKHIMDNMKSPVSRFLSDFLSESVDYQSKIDAIDAKIAETTDTEELVKLNATRQRYVDLESKQTARLSDLGNLYSRFGETDSDYQFDKNTAEIIAAAQEICGDTPLSQMTAKQLEAAKKAYTAVATAVSTENKNLIKSRYETVSARSEAAREQISKRPKKTEEGRISGSAIGKFFRTTADVNNLKPDYFIKRIASPELQAAYKTFRDGEAAKGLKLRAAKNFISEVNQKFKPWNWNINERTEIQDANGDTVRFSLGELMNIYALSKNEDSRRHLMEGGAELAKNADMGNGKKNLDTSAHALSEEFLSALGSEDGGYLTKDQIAYVDKMMEYMQETAKWGNEVSKKRYGIDLFNVENYWMMNTDPASRNDIGKPESKAPTLMNLGITQMRNNAATNPLVIRSFEQVWSSHVNLMADYSSFALPMEDLTRLWNYGGKNSVRNTVASVYGDHYSNYMDQLFADVVEGSKSDPREGTFNKLLSTAKASAVALNPSVILQQPTSIGRAMSMISPKYFKGDKVADAGNINDTWEQLQDYSGIAVLKDMGTYDIGMGRSASSWLVGEVNDPANFAESARAFFTDSEYRNNRLSELPGFADKITWCAMWEATKREVAATTDLKGQELLEAAGKRFDEVMEMTQVYDSVFSRSANMRAGGAMKAVTAFKAEPTVTANMIQDAVMDLKTAIETKDTSAVNSAGKKVGGVMLSILLNSAIAGIVKGIRNSDDKEKNFVENALAGAEGNLIDSVNPLTYIPYVSDLYSMAQGFDVDRLEYQIPKRMWQNVEAFAKESFKDTDNMTQEEYSEHEAKMAKYGLLAAGAFFEPVIGFSPQNMIRDIAGVYNAINSDYSNRASSGTTVANALKDELKDSFPIIRLLPSDSKSDRLYDAYMENDPIYINAMEMQYRDDDGAEKTKQIDSDLRKALRMHDSRIIQAADAIENGDNREAERIMKEIQDEGHFRANIIRGAVDSEIASRRPAASKAYSDDQTDMVGQFDSLSVYKELPTEIQARMEELVYTGDNIEKYNSPKEFAVAAFNSALNGYMDDLKDALRTPGATGYKSYQDLDSMYQASKDAGLLDDLMENSQGAAKYFLQAREDGYSVRDFAMIYNDYYDASKLDASNSEKALAFRDALQKHIEAGDISKREADYWRGEMKFYSMNAIGTGKYDEMTELGMSSTKAKITSQLISDFSSRYSDANGGKSPTNQAYYQEIAKQSNLTDDEKIQAMMSVTTNYNPNAESPNYSELKLQYMYNEFGLDPEVISEVWGALSENSSKRNAQAALGSITDDSGNKRFSSQEVQQLYALYHPDAKWKQTLIDLYG